VESVEPTATFPALTLRAAKHDSAVPCAVLTTYAVLLVSAFWGQLLPVVLKLIFGNADGPAGPTCPAGLVGTGAAVGAVGAAVGDVGELVGAVGAGVGDVGEAVGEVGAAVGAMGAPVVAACVGFFSS